MVRRRLSSAPERTGGFTLLEVLLAFVIFALSFATVLEIVSGSIRSTIRARDYSEAALLAQSLMDTVGTEIPLQETSLGGESGGGYRWTMDITTFQGEAGDERVMELAEMNGTLLFWVDLRMEWGEGERSREVTFTTIRGVLAGFEP